MEEPRRAFSEELVKTELFPAAGIGARACAANTYAIADRHADIRLADRVLRISAGRSSDEMLWVGEAVMDAAKSQFADKFSGSQFALSLEIEEADAKLRWKDLWSE